MTSGFLSALASLAAPGERAARSRTLAVGFGADDLIFFIKDPEIGAWLPALGYPKTLPGGRQWQRFLVDAVGGGAADAALLCPWTQASKRVRAVVGEGVVAAFIGGGGVDEQVCDELRVALPLIAALFSTERAALADHGYVLVAQRSAERAESLTASLAASQDQLHATLRALRASEAWLQTTLMSIGDAVICTDATARVTFINDVARDLTGWPLEDARGRPLDQIFSLVDEATRAVVRSPVDKVLQSGVVSALAQHNVLIRRDGREVNVEDTAAPIKDATGSVVGVVVVFRDVGERRAAERVKESLLLELQERVREGELFNAILAHDLRSPLNAIVTGAELLTEPDADAPKTAQRIARAGMRMRRMISQLLDLSRIRAGLVLEKKPHNLMALCEQVVGEQSAAASVRVEAHGDAVAAVDADAFSQIVQNLVGNALEHGDPSVPVRIVVDGSHDETIVVDFENGGAIPADILPSVFDPFRSGRRERSRGLGLGLSIVQRLARAHGGDVAASSSCRSGTRFRVSLPRNG